ncbi:MAG: hypothetical protein AAF585_15025, partial [Verrucomicrobiota bacterium]
RQMQHLPQLLEELQLLHRQQERRHLVHHHGKPGPIYQTHDRRDDALVIRFHSDSSPPKPTEGQISGFEIAGDDAKWVSAAAEFRNGELIVSNPEVSDPRYVRYQCATEPIGELIIGENGIPASPFCSNIDQLPWIDQK